MRRTWTLKRLTINYGLRWSILLVDRRRVLHRASSCRSGPSDRRTCRSGRRGRRGSGSYDLLGNAKTAIKFSVNSQLQSATNGVAAALNPMRLQSASVTWRI
jgi:hypothetical protein